VDGYVHLARRLDIPLTVELLHKSQYAEYVRRGAVAHLRTLSGIQGGITEMLKVAHLCESFGMSWEPHAYGGTMYQMANLHVILAVKNCALFELPIHHGEVGCWDVGTTDVIRIDEQGDVHDFLDRAALVTDQDLRRQVAMKVLRRDIGAGREQRLHFIAEAQATSQLEHPGIPPVHDMGLTKDGQLYFTMKLVQGRTLREVLHDLALKRKEVVREYNLHRLVTILERCCEPVHFGHEKGVVHRDLKPENIMLGDYGEVHVMDWGLARIQGTTDEYESFQGVETARTEAGFETQHGAVKGTLPYMSPEQLRGEEFDRRTDVYALGCLLYEVLTLHPAFDPRDSGLIPKKQMGDVPDVRSRNPRRKIPEPLAVVCEKALATDPNDRYGTADEMATALRKKFNAPAGRFTVILVGKDGGVKFKRHTRVKLSDIFALIDAMPMRQEEMRQKGRTF